MIYHPDIHQYYFHGITYQGLLVKENQLKSYSVGNYILNKSFVSTSKNRSVAQVFAQNVYDPPLIPVLLNYTTKQNQTAIDIQELSTIPDEEKVLI